MTVQVSAPRVSIIIPFFNKGHEISETLSRLARALEGRRDARERTEVLIVDDGSESNHAEMLDRSITRSGVKAQVIRQSNGGVSSARNAGIRAAKAEYLYFLDADDHLLDSFFDVVDAVVEASPTAGAYWAPLLINRRLLTTEEAGTHRIEDKLLLRLLNNRCLHLSCILFKRSTLEGIWFDERYKSAEDLLYIVKSLRGLDVAFGDRPYAIYNYDGKFHKADSSGYSEILRLKDIDREFKSSIQSIYNERIYLHNRFFNARINSDNLAIRPVVRLLGLLGSSRLYQFLQQVRFHF